MNVRHLVAAATVAVSAFALSGAASASEAELTGAFLLGAGSDVASFNFNISDAVPSSGVVTSINDFSYYVDGVKQSVTPTSVTFGATPGFDILFSGGTSLDVVTTSSLVTAGLVTKGTYIGSITGTPLSGGGVVEVAVSSVPLPAALPLFGAAFAGLAGLAGRKSNRSVAA